MTDHQSRGRPVKVRLMGAPDDVALMAERIEADPDVIVTRLSAPFPNRTDPDQVRVYLDAVDY